MTRIRRFLGSYTACLRAFVPLLAFGWLASAGRRRITELARSLGTAAASTVGLPSRLPSLPLQALADVAHPVVLLEPEAEKGNVTLMELLAIVHLVREARPRAVFEIGTFDGRTALNLAANTADECIVWTLDLPAEAVDNTALALTPSDREYVRKERSGARFEGRPEARKIRQLLGDSGSFDFGPYQGATGFVFVDGSHARDYVTSDSKAALRMLARDGGTVVWHDYGSWAGVTDALNALAETGPPWSDMRAVEGTTLVVLRVGDARGGARQ